MDPITTLYDILKAAGHNPFFIGQHQGECIENYVVVAEGAQAGRGSLFARKYINIYVNVPNTSYPELTVYSEAVQTTLRSIPWLKNTLEESTPIIDEDKKMYTKFIGYEINKTTF